MPPVPAVCNAFRNVEPGRIIELAEQRCQTRCNVAEVAHQVDNAFATGVPSMSASALLDMKVIT